MTEDVVTAAGAAGIHRQATEWAPLRHSGRTVRQWSHGTVGSDVARHSALLGLTLGSAFPVF